ncbi:hypothetical protein [Pseudoalteromonas rubra]|uniref:hypothetical protein n=1 Tax=Pseudoalteromonas rubra TaxID=43658 RepID=UPI001485E9E4|nr:hypothetical protein [Pseudoalteromonas rubra]
MGFKVKKKELKSLCGKQVLSAERTKHIAAGANDDSLQYSLITKTSVLPCP